ncbi:hypothetical protein [Legionella micdadei]|uniref:Uncharacterized protein n=1 Tax=Legionella micdadei TaxID=451 RepID=A0A098GFQ7_LEGMI|nr:hypothetical protein [Legionella micdadei]ARG97246.1 hypothetical protein B6N58_05985 [Legionella micdadei]ARH00497.1 hypothetical protein B6V88_08705 [Legionella micdadei]KTD29145.1 hypothetical protein Lmic_1065 [Legionella micdadei]NSL17479.1 hypothetical protein [Legionella micdadei]CEG61298.1 conserved exported protein of unknown function [Legionella micdadei]
MLRKICYGLLWAGALFSASVFAKTNVYMLGPGIKYEFFPGEPQILANYWFWSVTATCTFDSEDPSDDFLIEALSKSGKINEQTISAGDPPIVITVHQGQQITLSADSGAKVRLTNRGQNVVTAYCSV